MKHVHRSTKSELYHYRIKTGLSAKDFARLYNINITVLHNAENSKPIGKENAQILKERFGFDIVTSESKPTRLINKKAQEWNDSHPFRPDLSLENYRALYMALSKVRLPKRRINSEEKNVTPEEWMLDDPTDSKLYKKIQQLAKEETGRTLLSDLELATHKNADSYEVIKRTDRVSYVYFYNGQDEVDIVPVAFENLPKK